mgnify:CR=1 FL=1
MQQPKLKMLYGRDLKDYENMNVEDLLTQLSAEELEELSGTVDPDDSLLPPSQRCKEQTTKDPTGPLNRRQLLNFLTKFAKEQEDWPEDKKFVPGVKLGRWCYNCCAAFCALQCVCVCAKSTTQRMTPLECFQFISAFCSQTMMLSRLLTFWGVCCVALWGANLG